MPLPLYSEQKTGVESYKPRVDRKSVYFLCVQDHYEKLKSVWEERYQQGYNVPMKLDKISEILSEPDIIKDRKLSGKKVRENGEKKTIYS